MSGDIYEDGAKPSADYAATFRSVADKIDLNASNGFAGAFVIAPPGAEPKELLLLNNVSDPAMFWSLVKSTAEMAMMEIEREEAQRQQSGGYGRR